jgi:hypothetical protein
LTKMFQKEFKRTIRTPEMHYCLFYDNIRGSCKNRDIILKIVRKSINCRVIMSHLRGMYIDEIRPVSKLDIFFQFWLIENVFDVMVKHGLADLKEHMNALEDHMNPKTFSKMHLEVTDAMCCEVTTMLFTKDSKKTQTCIQKAVSSLLKIENISAEDRF